MEMILLYNRIASKMMLSFVRTRNGQAHRMIVPGLTGLLLCVLAGGLALGQTGSPPPFTVKHAPVPPTIQWFFFLSSVNHNDRAAVKWQLKGKDGTWIGNYHQVHLGLTDEQFQPIRATAQRLEAEFKEIGAKMQVIEVAERAAHPRQPGSPPELLPAPPEWTALNQQRKAVIEGEVANLRSVLGPGLTGILDNYIKSQIAPHVTTYQRKEVQP